MARILFNSYGEAVADIGILKTKVNKVNGIKALRVPCKLQGRLTEVENCWTCQHFNQVVNTRLIKCDFGIKKRPLDLSQIRMSKI